MLAGVLPPFYSGWDLPPGSHFLHTPILWVLEEPPYSAHRFQLFLAQVGNFSFLRTQWSVALVRLLFDPALARFFCSNSCYEGPRADSYLVCGGHYVLGHGLRQSPALSQFSSTAPLMYWD